MIFQVVQLYNAISPSTEELGQVTSQVQAQATASSTYFLVAGLPAYVG